MTAITRAARHRSKSKPVTPFTDFTDTVQFTAIGKRGVAVASATGIALTAVVATSASATTLPTTLPQGLSNDFVSNLSATDSATLVSLDIDWEPGDEVAVVAAEPEAIPEPVVEEAVAQDEVASRDYDRSADYVAAPAPSASGVVGTALQYVGYPYAWGGTTPAGFDCSGFVQYVFAQHGISLPRTSDAQGASGRTVSAAEAQPGDLVVSPGHIGIYTGGGQMVHAANYSDGVKVGPIYASWYFFVRI